MINATGWKIPLCEDGHIHIQLYEIDEIFGELILSDAEDISTFTDDIATMLDELSKGMN